MAAVSQVKPAIKAKLYRNTGSYASPTWTAVDLVRDVNSGKPWDLVDASVRGTRVKLYHPTQIDFAINTTVRCDDADAGYLALEAASASGGTLDLLVLDGAIETEGTRGLRAHFHVSDTGQDQSIGNVLYKQYDLKPGFSTDGYPKVATVGAASAVTYSDPG